jgi:retron-type reverse transcriptase
MNKPLKEGHRRLALHDERMQGGPNLGMRRDAAEVRRLCAGTLRTRDAAIRTLLPDEEQLRRYGLPIWRSEAEVAADLGISVKELRFFSIHRVAERVVHYVAYTIPKARGGSRLIMAPKRRLKAVQRLLLAKLVSKLPHSEQAHGFLPGRSVRTGAQPHVGRKVLLQMDLKDFFPSITFGRARGLLIALGYGYPVAATLAAVMTEAERQPVEIDGVVYHVPVGQRHTVQGAPTSPGLSNCVVLRLDRRLAGLARKFGFAYTRYADDLTFSGDDDSRLHGLRLQAQRIIADEGFQVNAEKTHVSRRGRRQRVTGVTVNEQLGLSRRERRRLRAAIHQWKQARAEGKADARQWQRLRGELAYLAMLNPQQAEALRRLLPAGEA